MSKTLLQGVNDVFNRVGINTSSGELASLSHTGKQVYIDLCLQLWNEVVDQICDLMGAPHPGETGSSTITLVSGTREYALPSDLVQIRWPLVNQTDGHYIWPYPGPNQPDGDQRHGAGDYEQMRIDQQIPADWTGLPYTAAINPTTGYLRMDRTPTSSEDGDAYDLLYDKDLVMDSATDTFPFSDATYRAVMPVVAEWWERKKRNDFDSVAFAVNISRAVTFANKNNRRTHW